MRVEKVEYLIKAGPFAKSKDWDKISGDLAKAIRAIVWPKGSANFAINPSPGKKRGEGNGVKPIKDACMLKLKELGWETDEKHNPLRFDAVKKVADGRFFGLEWETGNISSSHRSINRILLGHLNGELVGGALIVPTRSLYKFLTDRVGNYEELTPYFPLWRSCRWEDGVLVILAVEHDLTDPKVPRIAKGTDGRALV